MLFEDFTQRELHIAVFENLEKDRIKPIKKNIRALISFINREEFKQFIQDEINDALTEIENSKTMYDSLVLIKRNIEKLSFSANYSNLNGFNIRDILNFILDENDQIYKTIESNTMNIREKIEFVKNKIKPMTREEILKEKKSNFCECLSK